MRYMQASPPRMRLPASSARWVTDSPPKMVEADSNSRFTSANNGEGCEITDVMSGVCLVLDDWDSRRLVV
jgi:hypothetical protein